MQTDSHQAVFRGSQMLGCCPWGSGQEGLKSMTQTVWVRWVAGADSFIAEIGPAYTTPSVPLVLGLQRWVVLSPLAPQDACLHVSHLSTGWQILGCLQQEGLIVRVHVDPGGYSPVRATDCPPSTLRERQHLLSGNQCKPLWQLQRNSGVWPNPNVWRQEFSLTKQPQSMKCHPSAMPQDTSICEVLSLYWT